MSPLSVRSLRQELKQSLTRPWRLPINLFMSGAVTLLGIGLGIALHTFDKGLPYAAASVFVWSLATYNASQLGADSDKVLEFSEKEVSLRDLFIVKNLALMMLAVPIDLLLITSACLLINDWTHFWLAIVLALVAVVIGLGLGNIVSVIWVYKPTSLWQIRHDRLQLFEYGIFVTVSFAAASLALILASGPAALLLHVIGTSSLARILAGVIILFLWSLICWIVSFKVANHLAQRYHETFIGRLQGNSMNVKNTLLKRALKLDQE